MTSCLLLISYLFILVLSLENLIRWLRNSPEPSPAPPPPPSPSPAVAMPPPLSVSAPAVRWNETAMLVIDMQKDFILPEMESPVLVAGAKEIVAGVATAVDFARGRGVSVIWVVREHDPLGRDVELFRRHWYADGKGPTVKGSKGAELVDGLMMKEGEYKLVKTRFSAFFATHLDSLLKSSGIKNLVIVGVQTPNCIRQTVFDAVALDYQNVTVIVDATAAATPEVHSSNIRDMQNIGVATVTLQEWCRLDARLEKAEKK